MFDWLQTKTPGDRFTVSNVAKDPRVFVAHAKYYIDTVRQLPEYNQIEFNTDYSKIRCLS